MCLSQFVACYIRIITAAYRKRKSNNKLVYIYSAYLHIMLIITKSYMLVYCRWQFRRVFSTDHIQLLLDLLSNQYTGLSFA